MGYVTVKVAIESVASPIVRREIELLVDTEALYSIAPAQTLREMNVRPRDREEFELADGRVIERDVGEVRFYYDGKSATSPVIFGEEADAAVLGVVTLESMGLEVDAARGRIRPLRKILY